MTHTRSPIAFICSALALTACSIDEVTINEPSPTPTPMASNRPPAIEPALPRLAAGPHLGMITGFDSLSSAQTQEAAQRYADARAAGASIGRIQIDWADLETAPGQYNAGALEDAFAPAELDGMNLVVTLSTLDSDGLTLPAYLLDNGALRSGLTLNSPEVRDAFIGFLDWLAPQLEQRNVWLLSIGNEPLGPIEDGLASETAATGFYSAAFDHWNEQVADIGITLTFTTAAPDGIPTLFSAVRSRADIVAFNYYCLSADILVTTQSDWEQRLAKMKADAGDRDIFFQELGCPVGYAPQGRASAIGGSLDNQVRFFEFFGDRIAADPQLRAATLFQLYDWSPQLARNSAQPLVDAGLPAFAARFEEWLATVGLLRWSDAGTRPAWQTWLAQLERVRAARGD